MHWIFAWAKDVLEQHPCPDNVDDEWESIEPVDVVMLAVAVGELKGRLDKLEKK